MLCYVKESNVALGSKEILDIVIVNSDRNMFLYCKGCQELLLSDIVAGSVYNLQIKQWKTVRL